MIKNQVNQIFKKKFNSEFNRNVLTLLSGTIIAQAIPIAITPILTRLYSPEDFGVLALFAACTAVLSSVAAGRYEMAIMSPQKDEDAINIAFLCFIIVIGFSMLLIFIFFFFNEKIYILLKNNKIGVWLYFIPFVVFITGIYNILKYLNIRKKFYKNIAKSSVDKSISNASVQLFFGSLKNGEAGLVLGQIISPVIGNIRLFKNVKEKYNFQQIKKKKIKYLAKLYSNFPKYASWAILFNSLSNSVNNILISTFYSLSTLGFYSVVQRVLALPSSLLGNSIGEVYFQEATREKQKTGKAIVTFNKTLKKLLIISILIFLPLYFFLPELFKIVFGEKWQIAGEYGQIILPFVSIQFIVTSLSTTNMVFEKQKIALAWQLGLLLGSITTIFYANINEINFENFLKIYTSFLFLYNLFLLMIIKKVSNRTL